jgi:chromosome segregation ATPase
MEAVKALQAEASAAQKDAAAVRAECHDLQAQLAAAGKRLHAAEASTGILNTRLQEAAAQLAAVKEEVESLNRQAGEQRAEHVAALAAAQERSADVAARLERAEAARRGAESALAAAQAQHAKHKAELQGDIERLRTEAARKWAERQPRSEYGTPLDSPKTLSRQHSAAPSRPSSPGRGEEAARQLREEAAAHAAAAEQAQSRLLAAQDAHEKHAKQWAAEKEQLSAAASALHAELAEARAELDEQRGELARACAAQLSPRTPPAGAAEVGSLRRELAAATSERSAAQHSAAQRERQLADAQRRVAELEEHLSAVLAQVNASTPRSAGPDEKKKRRGLFSRRPSSAARAEPVQALAAAELALQPGSARSSLDASVPSRERLTLSEQIAQLAAEKGQLEGSIAALRAEQERVQQHAAPRAGEPEQAPANNAVLAQLRAANAELQSAESGLQARIAEQGEAMQRLRAENEGLIRQLAQLRGSSSSDADAAGAQAEAVRQLRAELGGANARCEAAAADALRALQASQELTQRNEQLQSEASSLSFPLSRAHAASVLANHACLSACTAYPGQS